jgi:hypothetical protein
MSRSNRRLVPMVFAAILGLFAASTASAVSFYVTELSGCSATPSAYDCVGTFPGIDEIITIGIRVRSEPGEQVFGIGASVWGYGSATEFVSGEAVESVFHDVLATGIGQGLDNLVAGSLSESTCCGLGSAVGFLNAISFQPRSENPFDPGLDGVLGGGDAQFRVRFRVSSFGPIGFQIGTGYDGDGVLYAGGETRPGNNAIIGMNLDTGITLTQPIPEPGTTLLLGLGLFGLASATRSRSLR